MDKKEEARKRVDSERKDIRINLSIKRDYLIVLRESVAELFTSRYQTNWSFEHFDEWVEVFDDDSTNEGMLALYLAHCPLTLDCPLNCPNHFLPFLRKHNSSSMEYRAEEEEVLDGTDSRRFRPLTHLLRRSAKRKRYVLNRREKRRNEGIHYSSDDRRDRYSRAFLANNVSSFRKVSHLTDEREWQLHKSLKE